jgi:SprT protein
MTQTTSGINIYKAKLRPDAFAYFEEICTAPNFNFILGGARLRKLGDFRSLGKKPISISINHDLNHDFFFFVLLHEWAHYLVFERYQRRVQPHGPEWKLCYQQLLHQALDKNLFSAEMAQAVQIYAKNPKANLATSPALMMLLKDEVPQKEHEQALHTLAPKSLFAFNGLCFYTLAQDVKKVSCIEIGQVAHYQFKPDVEVRPLFTETMDGLSEEHVLDFILPNEIFEFQNIRFQAIEKRRTKYLCLNLQNQNQYLIQAQSMVVLKQSIGLVIPKIVPLESLKVGQNFMFNGHHFNIIEPKGKDWLCQVLGKQEHYLISVKNWVKLP